MFKLDLGKAEEPEIKLSTSIGSSKKREFQKNTFFYFIDYANFLAAKITINCGKFFKRWEYQTTLPISWEICMQLKMQQWELYMEQQTGSKLGKEYVKAVYCYPAENIMWNSRLDEAQAGIKIARRNINNLRYTDGTTLMAESEEELKSLLKVKEESEKAGLRLNIQKTKIMAAVPITSWQIDGEMMETVRDYFGGALKSLQMVTAAMKLKDSCFLEEKLWLTQIAY